MKDFKKLGSVVLLLLCCAGCATNTAKPEAEQGQETKEQEAKSQEAKNQEAKSQEEQGNEANIEQDAGDSDENFPYKNYSPDTQGPSVVGYQEVNDPFEKVNRVVFKFNDVSYRYVLSPLATGYKKITPDPVETGVSNVFDNIYEPISVINHLFRLQPKSAVKGISRFCINSTIGLLGIFDVADKLFKLERDESTFANTLMDYNVGQGPYLVLPILGPSNLRDSSSMLFDYFTNPLNAVKNDDHRMALKLMQSFDKRKDELDQYDELVEDAKDPYEFLRGYYIQNDKRDAEIIQEQDNKKP
ncbi:putative phospholipid-binding lipoprotein MlaA [Thalassocella blandensis]|nr:putative phospholipid-binding lipoprotein MlaA [Thalassocella blandensis]